MIGFCMVPGHFDNFMGGKIWGVKWRPFCIRTSVCKYLLAYLLILKSQYTFNDSKHDRAGHTKLGHT